MIYAKLSFVLFFNTN